ncbi:MAG: TetR/AcrR family transcriptional regulator [Nitrospirales bacterium]
MNKSKRHDIVRFSRTERQASIIAAAASLFAVNGFMGTTTREIAKTAGISKALLFKYFHTKQALYAAILAEKAPISDLLEVVEDAAKKRDDVRVFTLIASYRIHGGSDPTLMRLLLFSALEGHELSDLFFQNQHRMFYDYLCDYIARRIGKGRLSGSTRSWRREGSWAWWRIIVCCTKFFASRRIVPRKTPCSPMSESF